MGYVYACKHQQNHKLCIEKHPVVQRFIYEVFIRSKGINSQMSIYATHFILSEYLSENFVTYSFIHFNISYNA